MSGIDNRWSIGKKNLELEYRSSIIDTLTTKLQQQLGDTTLEWRFITFAFNRLGEGQLLSIADYAVRKGNIPGRLFVRICMNEMRKRGLLGEEDA